MEYLPESPSGATETVTNSRAERLLDALPWGLLLLSTHGHVLYLNPPATAYWGVSQAEAKGQTLAQVGPHLLPEPFYAALHQAATGEELAASTYYLPAAGQWLALTSQPDPEGVLLHWQAVVAQPPQPPAEPWPEQASSEVVVRQSEAHYRSLFETMEQGFCLIEKVITPPGAPSDYRYLTVNAAFARHAGLHDVTGRTLRQVVPGVEARIVAAYDEAAASGETRHFESYVADLDVWIAAEVIPASQPGRLAVLFSDVSARHRAEQRLRESEAKQSYLLALSDALRPVREVGAIQATVTHAAQHYFRADRCCYGEIEGDTVTIQPEAAGPDWPSVAGGHSLRTMPIFSELLQAGRPVVVADVSASPVLGDSLTRCCLANHIRAYLSVPVVRHERLVGLLCLVQSTPREWTDLDVALVQETAERTWAAVERARAEKALRRSEEQFRSLVTATSDTVYKMSPDWRQMHQLLGKNFLADTPSSSGTWLAQYIPAADQPPVLAAIEAAIEAKTIFELEHRVVQTDGSIGWTYSRAIPVLDAQGTITEWLGAAQDVTARKQAEAQLQDFTAGLEQQVAERTQALRESRDLLHAVAQSQTVVLNAFRAVRDDQHQLVDFLCIFSSACPTQPTTGQPVVGQPHLAQSPAAERTRLRDFYGCILDTGLQQEEEVARPPGRWLRIITTKLGDGVLISEEDITLRKRAEQERIKTLWLLEQSEEVANMGSWEYELATGLLLWSGGMYRLFGLTPTDPVGMGRYHDAVVPEDQPVAERLAQYLTAGAAAFEETLRLQIGNQVKSVRIRAVVRHDERGQPSHVLGVDLDISDVQRLEAENLTLRLNQQKALLQAILHAQETERNRLAESLHNSLGQVLYAARLQVSQLDVPALHDLPALRRVHSHVDQLLSEAIRQTRTLAHELLPATLTERGLGPALRDICRSLTTPRLRFTCQVWLDEQVLPPPLQTTLYRLAQELALNIAKHSGASRATLEFELLPGWVSLRAEDNGRGFDPATTTRGLGLHLLQEAVNLLGGTILLTSSPEYGTHIRLRIPII